MRCFFSTLSIVFVALVMFVTAPAAPAHAHAKKAKSSHAHVKKAKSSHASVAAQHRRTSTKAVAQNKSNCNTTAANNLASDERQQPAPSLVPLDDSLGISAQSAVIMDANTGYLLYSRAPDEPHQPASTIKVLTGLLAIKRLNAGDMVSASQHAVCMPASKVYLREGAKYPADDMINAVLLASANDASVAVAEKIAGSEWAFARMMTSTAQAMGAKNTVAMSATGLTTPGQQTTARDLAVIFAQAVQQPKFAAVVGQRQVKTKSGMVLRNHNRALWEIAGSVGGKTGFTNVARKTYVGKFKRGQDELVVSMLASERMWEDVRTLVEHGFKKKSELRLAESKAQQQLAATEQADTKKQPKL